MEHRQVHPSFGFGRAAEAAEDQAALSPIEEDDEQLKKLEEVSPRPRNASKQGDFRRFFTIFIDFYVFFKVF